MGNLKSFTPQGRWPYLCNPSWLWITVARVCFFLLGVTIFPFLLLVLMLSFWHSLWRCCSSNFQIPFRGNYYIYSCRFVVSMRGSELQIFLWCYLESSSLSSPTDKFLITCTSFTLKQNDLPQKILCIWKCLSYTDWALVLYSSTFFFFRNYLILLGNVPFPWFPFIYLNI